MSLTVLLDGHRKKVPVTAGTSMSDVLRKACELHDVDVDRHELRHKNAVVDLSLPFRLTGISSNATLDMVAKKGGANDPIVRVCIQLVDGRRVQGNFGSSHTLAAILAQLQIHLSPEFDSLNFMRRDIRGPELDTLTLQALGLVSGSGMFRVQSSASSPVAPPPRVVAAPAPSTTHVTTPMPAAAPLTPVIAPIAAVPEPAVTAPSPPALPSTPYEAIQCVRNSNFDAVSSTVVLTLMKILCNILSKPDEPKVRSIRSSNPKFVDAVGRHPGGIEFLLASGFVVDGEMLHLASESSDVLQRALRVLQDEADDLRIDHSARPQVQVPSTLPAPAFDAYQPLITRIQAQPRGASITEMRLDDLKKKQDALLASSTPARQTRILFPHELQHATTAAPTSVGKSDAQLLAQALKARQDAAEKSQSFRTLAMRELDDMQRRSVYQEAVLRVRFPDKVVLQAVFHPNEPLQAVADHVASCLATPLAFYLYTTPPMTKLDVTKSLIDLNLVPASNIFLGWTSPPTGTTELGAYLNQDVLDEVGAESKDDDSRSGLAYPSSQPLVPSSKAASSSTAADAKTTTTASGRSSASTKGRPGWLKL